MPPKSKPGAIRVPKELQPFAKFLDGHGYSIAIPFDDVRQPGYIATFNEKGQEIIVDSETCLANIKRNKPGNLVLGSYNRSSKFGLAGLLKIFGNLLNIDFDFLKAKSASISFQNPIQRTEFLTEMDVEEALSGLGQGCKNRITDPSNFVILQVLQTDSLQYSFELKTKASAEGRAHLDKRIAAAKAADVKVSVDWESDTKFNLTLNTTLTVGYKTAGLKFQAMTPAAFTAAKKRMAAGAGS